MVLWCRKVNSEGLAQTVKKGLSQEKELSMGGRRQSCLAHIDRSLAKMEQREGVDAFLGKTSQKELGKIFALWHEYKAGKFSREELQEKEKDPIENIRTILNVYGGKGKSSSKQILSPQSVEMFFTSVDLSS